MTVLPRHLLARFLRRELPEDQAEEYGLDVSEFSRPAPIRTLLFKYEDDNVEVTEEDRADLKEALLVAVNRGLGDIGREIVTTLTGVLFEDLGNFRGDDRQPSPAAVQPRPRAEADATDPDQPAEDQDPKPPTAGRRKTRRRPKTRMAKKSRRTYK